MRPIEVEERTGRRPDGSGADASPRRGLRLRSSLSLALAAAVSLGLLWFSFARLDASALLAQLATVRVGVLGVSLVFIVLALGAATARSVLLLRRFPSLRPWGIAKSLLVAFGGNNVLPFRLGELLRVDYLARLGGVERAPCLAVVALERLLDVVALALVFVAVVVLALPGVPDVAAVGVVGAVALTALVALAVVGRRPWLLGRAADGLGARLLPASAARALSRRAAAFAEGLSGVAGAPSAVAVFLATLAYWAAQAMAVWAWLVACRLELGPAAALTVVVFTSFGSLIPALPSAVGTYHYAIILALSLFGVAAGPAAAFALVAHGTATVPLTLGAVPVVVSALAGLLAQRRPARGVSGDGHHDGAGSLAGDRSHDVESASQGPRSFVAVEKTPQEPQRSQSTSFP